MLSKKYYKIFAKILGESNTVVEVIEALNNYFKTDNPNFSSYKFRVAIDTTEKNKQ